MMPVVRVHTDNILLLDNSVHRTEGAGGALRISDVSVRVDSSNFTRNFAQFGGAIVLFSELGSYLSPAFPISWNITSCIVEENGEYLSTTSQPWQQSPRSLIGGGILFNNPSRVALEGCKIRHNVARVYGMLPERTLECLSFLSLSRNGSSHILSVI